MKILPVTIEFHSYWHIGSGLGRGPEADATVWRDEDGLPGIAEGGFRGQLRDALESTESIGRVDPGITAKLFGPRNPTNDPSLRGIQTEGLLAFQAARLESSFRRTLASSPKREVWIRGLTRLISSTALKDGVAKKDSLRTVEVVIPCTLETVIEGPDDEQSWVEQIKACKSLFRRAGLGRHRGFGRCTITFGTVQTSSLPTWSPVPNQTTSGWFKVTLLSNTTLSRRPDTTGAHESLDHIPGSVFFGAAIRKLGFDHTKFLSGQNRFGTAYPVGSDGAVGFPKPASWFCKKLDQNSLINGLDPNWGGENQGSQPKQIRAGFVSLSATPASLNTAKSFRPKASMDPDKYDRVKDGVFFGLQSIAANQEFAFQLEAQDGNAFNELAAAMVSHPVRIGRGRNPGYGRVRITSFNPTAPKNTEPILAQDSRWIILYAWSDLALTDGGFPTLQPKASHFGLPDGTEWLPERSFIRTRRYSPWNGFYIAHAEERVLISMGSVLVFETPTEQKDSDLATLGQSLTHGVGLYREEGFGKVLVNPKFVVQPGYSSVPPQGQISVHNPFAAITAPPLASRLATFLAETTQAVDEHTAQTSGRQFAELVLNLMRRHADNLGDRRELPGASQWSQINTLCARHRANPGAFRSELSKLVPVSATGLQRENRSVRHQSWHKAIAGAPAATTMASKLLEFSPTNPTVDTIRALYHATRWIHIKLKNQDRSID